MKGKGIDLALPPLPLVPPITVRLVRSDSPACWEATYTTPIKNDAEQLKAKSN